MEMFNNSKALPDSTPVIGETLLTVEAVLRRSRSGSARLVVKQEGMKRGSKVFENLELFRCDKSFDCQMYRGHGWISVNACHVARSISQSMPYSEDRSRVTCDNVLLAHSQGPTSCVCPCSIGRIRAQRDKERSKCLILLHGLGLSTRRSRWPVENQGPRGPVERSLGGSGRGRRSPGIEEGGGTPKTRRRMCVW
jgi:hypothetical protein